MTIPSTSGDFTPMPLTERILSPPLSTSNSRSNELLEFGFDTLRRVLHSTHGHPTTPHRDTVPEDLLPPSHIDFSDNKKQLLVLKHHYECEFHSHALDDLLQDYREDSVLYTVRDGMPRAYRGRTDIRQYFRYMHLDHVALEHISIHDNHAQVVWKGTPEVSKKKGDDKKTTILLGTDSYTFDAKDNRIASQTTVALSTETVHEDERLNLRDDRQW